MRAKISRTLVPALRACSGPAPRIARATGSRLCQIRPISSAATTAMPRLVRR